MDGFHHLRMRAQMKRGIEPFPARAFWKRVLDYLMYGVGLIAPLALLPQALNIYETKSAAGVSLVTWLLLTLFNFLWSMYGAAHRDAQLFFANVLMTLFDLAIVVGLLLY